MLGAAPAVDRVLSAIDDAAAEIVGFTSDLIRMPTVNPPGDAYDDCAHVIGDKLAANGFEVEYFPAEGRPEHTRDSSARQRRRPAARTRAPARGPSQRPLRCRAGRNRMDGRSVRGHRPRRPHLRSRRVRHEGRHRRGGLRRRSDPPRRRRARRVGRDQRHRRRGKRRVRRRRLAGRTRPPVVGAAATTSSSRSR